MILFADTSGWMSLFDPRGRDHEHTKAWMAQANTAEHRFITTDYVLDETITGLLGRANHATAEKFARWVLTQRHTQVINLTEEIWHEALEMFYQYNDKHYSFTDCTSFVVMHKRKLYDAFALDHHFEQMGFRLWPR
jgi:predicted nucleic acid-binding protein